MTRNIFKKSIGQSQFSFRPNKKNFSCHIYNKTDCKESKETRSTIALQLYWLQVHLWLHGELLHQIGIHSKCIEIIINLYGDRKCTVNTGGRLTDWFLVNVRVRQGCIMSTSLFNILLKYVMKDITNLDGEFKLKDDMSIGIRYADDNKLISPVFEKLNTSTLKLKKYVENEI